MRRKLFSLLTLTIFVGINAAQLPTDAETKISNILKQMGVLSTTPGCRIEVSPGAEHINTFSTKNHECTKSEPISKYIRRILNHPKKQSERDNAEADLFCYRLGTRLQIDQKPNKSSVQAKLKKIVPFNAYMIPRMFVSYFVQNKLIYIPTTDMCKKMIRESFKPWETDTIHMVTTLFTANLIDCLFKDYIYDLSNHYYKKQAEKELNKKTSYNAGYYKGIDYSKLPSAMQSLLLKTAYEKGREAQQKQSPNSS